MCNTTYINIKIRNFNSSYLVKAFDNKSILKCIMYIEKAILKVNDNASRGKFGWNFENAVNFRQLIKSLSERCIMKSSILSKIKKN